MQSEVDELKHNFQAAKEELENSKLKNRKHLRPVPNPSANFYRLNRRVNGFLEERTKQNARRISSKSATSLDRERKTLDAN